MSLTQTSYKLYLSQLPRVVARAVSQSVNRTAQFQRTCFDLSCLAQWLVSQSRPADKVARVLRAPSPGAPACSPRAPRFTSKCRTVNKRLSEIASCATTCLHLLVLPFRYQTPSFVSLFPRFPDNPHFSPLGSFSNYP